jgi:hypothetical protein
VPYWPAAIPMAAHLGCYAGFPVPCRTWDLACRGGSDRE